MLKLWIALTVAAVLLGGCAEASHLDVDAESPETAREEPADTGSRLTTYDDLDQAHARGAVDYPDEDVRPPAGGPHNLRWQNCGVYTEPIASEHAVHSLEHGAVWITYTPDLEPGDLADVQAAVGASGYVLVSPYEGQESPIVLTAWGVQLEVDDISAEQVDPFLTTYVQGAQTPEPGAPCTGGTNASAEQAKLRSAA